MTKSIPIHTIKVVFTERFYEKFDVIKIGSQNFVVTTPPIKVEGGYEVELGLPLSAEFVTINICQEIKKQKRG